MSQENEKPPALPENSNSLTNSHAENDVPAPLSETVSQEPSAELPQEMPQCGNIGEQAMPPAVQNADTNEEQTIPQASFENGSTEEVQSMPQDALLNGSTEEVQSMPHERKKRKSRRPAKPRSRMRRRRRTLAKCQAEQDLRAVVDSHQVYSAKLLQTKSQGKTGEEQSMAQEQQGEKVKTKKSHRKARKSSKARKRRKKRRSRKHKGPSRKKPPERLPETFSKRQSEYLPERQTMAESLCKSRKTKSRRNLSPNNSLNYLSATYFSGDSLERQCQRMRAQKHKVRQGKKPLRNARSHHYGYKYNPGRRTKCKNSGSISKRKESKKDDLVDEDQSTNFLVSETFNDDESSTSSEEKKN